MTEAKETTDVRRGTIFGRDAINRNDLLKALVVDGQDKVRLDDIQNYVNKSQQQAQHLGWYKFAALFGFIIIILQALTTFGVVLWGADVSRARTATVGHVFEATGENIYTMLNEGGFMPEHLNELVMEDADGNVMAFNSIECTGYSVAEGVKDAYTLYTAIGQITVEEDELAMTIEGTAYTSGGSRRRLYSAHVNAACGGDGNGFGWTLDEYDSLGECLGNVVAANGKSTYQTCMDGCKAGFLCHLGAQPYCST